MATAPTAPSNVDQEVEELPISVSNREREEGDLDITPMIDITFLLLIFFLVSSKMDQDAAVDLPPAKNGMGVVNNQAVLLILRKGQDRRASLARRGRRGARPDPTPSYAPAGPGGGTRVVVTLESWSARRSQDSEPESRRARDHHTNCHPALAAWQFVWRSGVVLPRE